MGASSTAKPFGHYFREKRSGDFRASARDLRSLLIPFIKGCLEKKEAAQEYERFCVVSTLNDNDKERGAVQGPILLSCGTYHG